MIIRRFIRNALCLFPFEHFDAVIQKRILKRLSKRIKSCGRSVVLSRGLMVERPEKLYIDNDVSLTANISIMGVGGCHIGSGSMIETGVTILTTMHDPTAPIMRKTGIHKPVTIGKEVWIGAGAIILPGVSIGDNSIVVQGLWLHMMLSHIKLLAEFQQNFYGIGAHQNRIY